MAGAVVDVVTGEGAVGVVVLTAGVRPHLLPLRLRERPGLAILHSPLVWVHLHVALPGPGEPSRPQL